MNKTADKVFPRKDITRISKNEQGCKDVPRPRSRSVFTNSHVSDDMPARDMMKLEGPPSWPPYVPKPITVKNYFAEDFNEYYGDDPYQVSGTIISPHGVITLRLNERIRVDISPEKAVRVANAKNGIVLALSASGSSSGLIHPNGRVYQYGSRVEIMANDGQGNDKEKMRIPTWSQAQNTLSRKKLVIQGDDTKLAKVLSTLDLTLLGVGSTLGVGVYVLAGEVAKTTAGPAVIISFLIAALASILAGLCYAEFGARVPKAGSAYVYSYVCIGELFAFIIGWNLILEYLIGSASCVKALFLYFDNLADNSMSNYFQQTMPMNGGQIATYADVFSLALSIVFAVALAFGAKESSLVNNVFTFINIGIVLLVIISGVFKSDPKNWNRTAHEAMGIGLGGFAPYGIKGIIKGAAKCFYGFIGFDCIATAGEEAKTPQKSIPIGVVVSLFIVFLSYFGMSTVLTMMLPYYEQDTTAPLPHVYEQIGWTAVKYVVSIGACCGLFSSLLGAMFPLPRIIYAMASDGLLFRTLAKVHPKFQTPFMGTLLAGAVTGILACLFELSKLTEMMSIGTLLAYSMVAACVLVLRYAPDSKKSDIPETITFRSFIKQTMSSQTTYPTKVTSAVVSWLIIVFFMFCFIISGLMTGFEDNLYRGELWLICLCVVLGAFLIFLLFIVSLQPTSDAKLSFTVPMVPWIPGISIFINIYLMTNINKDTWLKYVYWMLIGLVIYLTYGIWHSNERSPPLTTKTKSGYTNGHANGHVSNGVNYYGATVANNIATGEEEQTKI